MKVRREGRPAFIDISILCPLAIRSEESEQSSSVLVGREIMCSEEPCGCSLREKRALHRWNKERLAERRHFIINPERLYLLKK